MKFRMIHEFDWPAAPIVEMLKNGEDICAMEDLPNVSSRKVIERKRDGKKMYSKIEWNVHGQIPKIAQKILSPEMLTFTEDTVWDDDDTSFTTKIIPRYLKKKFKCNTYSKWSEAGERKAKRRFEGTLTVSVPIIGPIVERTVIEHLKKNNDKNAEMVRKFLAQKLGPPGE